jgi:SAM-dependent methyltransferase
MTAPTYDEAYYAEGQIDADRVALWWYARVVSRLRRQGGRLLEFGCGTGHLLKRLSQRFETYGYDVSPVARQRCRKTATDAVVLEEWQSQPDASFEVIVSLHTLEHLPQPLPVMQQLAAKLAAGGAFFFVVPNPGGIGHRLKGKRWFAYRDPTHCSLLSRGEWVALVRRSGLEVVQVSGDGLWDAPYIPWVPTVVQRAFFGAPAAVQVFAPVARPFLPAAWGECLIVTAEKPR